MSERPSKKQRELLSFLDGFIKGNGYGPSYREVMRALDYKSVSTVATHINGLIKKGFLRKKNNSARSLEVINMVALEDRKVETKSRLDPLLKVAIENRLELYISSPSDDLKSELFTLISALRLIKLDTEYEVYNQRYEKL